jgi:hypothetical protein
MMGYGVEHLRPPNKAMNLSKRKRRSLYCLGQEHSMLLLGGLWSKRP